MPRPITGYGRRDPEEMYRSNVEGTRHVLEAARQAGVERCVYTSTVGCVGIPENGVGDEGVPAGLDAMAGPYKRSKFLAEQVALEFARDGFPVVIVNPTAPIGDHDFRPTPTGRIVVDFLRGAMPAFLDTGLNVVYAGDVAAGHFAACERGRIGERYILGGENLTLQQIFEKLAEVTGRAAPRMRIPYAVAYAAGRRIDGLGGRDRQGTSGAARCGAHGAKEDVGAERQSGGGIRVHFAARGRGIACSGRVVSSEWIL